MDNIENQQKLSEDEEDVYEPGTIDEVISFLKRRFNQLNEENIVIRKKAITEIYDKLQKEKQKLQGMSSQQLIVKFYKNILKGFTDQAEKVREFSIRIMRELIVQCDDATQFLPYIISIITERVNCHDLEGILDLPEVMRPPPGQKPKQMFKLIEQSEELRIQLCLLMNDIITITDQNIIYDYVDDITNILRALAMDPNPQLQQQACQTISNFCKKNQDLLLHFTEMLSRSILLPLISKRSRVRIAAIEALTNILYCGVWKYNAFVFEILVGFRDPNSVAIKAFYEPMHNINYLATLIEDPKSQVREMFIKGCGEWLINLPDRYDHHPRIIPYILSGLFDEHPDIRRLSYEILEEAGIMEEKEKEKEIRESRQFGVDSEWTQNSKLVHLPLPDPFTKRPGLGSRLLVRSHVRKYWKALYSEIKDLKMENRRRTSSLCLVSIVYSEDYMTQYLDVFVRNMVWQSVPREGEDNFVASNIGKAFELIGRFCPYTTYMPLIRSGLKGELSQNDDYIKASIQTLACLVKGALEATVEGEGFTKQRMDFVYEVINLISENDILNTICHYNVHQTIYLMQNLINGILYQSSKNQMVEIGQHKSNEILQIQYILIYLAYFDKIFLLNVPYYKETMEDLNEKLKTSQLLDLTQDAFNICQNRSQTQKELLEMFYDSQGKEKTLSFSHFSWRHLIGQFIFMIYKDPNTVHIDQLKVILISTLDKNNNQEISDFVTKLALLVTMRLQQITQSDQFWNQSVQLQLFTLSNNICGLSMHFISTLDQLNEKIAQNFLILLQQISEKLYSKNNVTLTKRMIEQQEFEGLSKILSSIPVLWRKFYRKNPAIEMLQIINVLIENISQELKNKCQYLIFDEVKIIKKKQKKEIQVPIQKKVELMIKDEKYENQGDTLNKEKENQKPSITQDESLKNQEEIQKTIEEPEKEIQQEVQQFEIKIIEEDITVTETSQEFVIPRIIQFSLKRIETLGDQPTQKHVDTAFAILHKLLSLIPLQRKNIFYRGNDEHIDDFSEFLDKLLKYAVNENDLEIRKKYMEIFWLLMEKTPYNFQMEFERAESNKQFSRVTLLRKILWNKD